MPFDLNNYNISDLTNFINQRKQVNGIDNNNYFSLAELRLSNNDYQFLLTWASNLDIRTISQILMNYSFMSIDKKKAFGLYFLFLSAEVTRREGVEGKLWSKVASKFKDNIKNILFDSSNNPNYYLKKAIFEATEYFEIRNSFDIEDTLSYYNTIYLQFGFTCNGLINNLPIWLSGYSKTKSIEILLGDSKYSSNSFKELWNKLLAFKNNNITEQNLRSYLINSPWIINDYIDKIIVSCRQNIEGNTREDEISYFDVKYDYNNNGFTIIPKNINLLNLVDSQYDIFINNIRVSRLINNGENYELTNQNIFIDSNNFSNNLKISILSKNLDIVKTQVITLLDLDSDLNIFDSSGNIIDAWNNVLSINKSYIIFMKNLNIECNNIDTNNYKTIGDYKIYLIPQNWNTIRIFLKDSTIWESLRNQIETNDYSFLISPSRRIFFININQDGNINIEEDKTLYINNIQENLNYRLYIIPNQNNNLRLENLNYIKNFSNKIIIDNNNIVNIHLHGTNLRAISIDNFDLRNYPFFKSNNIYFKYNNSNLLRKNIDFECNKLLSVYVFENNEWKLVNTNSFISVEKAKTSLFKFVLKNIDRNKYSIVEGSYQISELKSYKSEIRGLSGYGQKLKLQEGFYNSLTEFIIFDKVYNFGIAKTAYYSDDNIKFELSTERELKNKKVIFWQPNYISEEYNLEDIAIKEKNNWIINIPEKEKHASAVAITQYNYRLVSCWKKDLFEKIEGFFSQNQNEEDFNKLLFMIRFLYLPICSENLKNILVESINKDNNIINFIKCWILKDNNDNNIISNLNLDLSYQEKWFSAIREIFFEYESNIDISNIFQIEDIIKILDTDPILLYKLLLFSNNRQEIINDIFEYNQTHIVNIDILNILLSSISQRLLIDTNFIKNNILNAFDKELNRNNLMKLLTNQELRKLVFYILNIRGEQNGTN